MWLAQSNPVFRTVEGIATGMGRFSEALEATLSGRRLFDIVTMGDQEAAGLCAAVNQAIDRLGPGVLLNTSRASLNTLRPVFLSSISADGIMKFLNSANLGIFEYGGQSPWMDWKEEHTVRQGGYW